MVFIDLQADKATKTDYNELEYINKKLTDNNIEIDDDIAIVNGWKFLINRTVPKIDKDLGFSNEYRRVIIEDGNYKKSELGEIQSFSQTIYDGPHAYNTELVVENGQYTLKASGRSWGAFCFDKPINMNGVNKMVAEVELYSNKDIVSSNFRIGLCNDIDTTREGFYKSDEVRAIATEKVPKTIELDVSDLEGEYYLKMVAAHGGEYHVNTAFVNILKVTLYCKR